MPNLQQEYEAALEAYVAQGGESALKQAYELGRQALADGLGVLDMVALHQRALDKLMNENPQAVLVHRAGEFLGESMSPFEMTHRAYGEANTTLRRLNDSLESQTRKLANTLHDESGQLLSAVHIQLQEIAKGFSPEERAKLDSVRQLLDQIEQQLRQFSHDLRPTVLDDYGLVPAIQWLAGRFSKRMGIPVTVDAQSVTRLPATTEAALYRIAQEALNNAARHAKAARVQIRLKQLPGELHCSIRDDGVGFDVSSISSKKTKGLGLLGIQDRLSGLGAKFQIRSAAHEGTELSIIVPLEE